MTIDTVPFDGVPLRVSTPNVPATRAVIVLHQAPGYSAQTSEWLEKLAADGYLAVAPLLLHRAGVEAVNPMADFGGDQLAFAAFLPSDSDARDDITAALDYVEAAGIAPSATGILGFSYGGRAAYLIGSERALGAVVTYYGGGVQRKSFDGNDALPALTERASSPETPWLGLFGEDDFMLGAGELDDWQIELQKAPVEATLIRYSDAGHAFDVDVPFGPGMPSPYAEHAAVDAAKRTSEFFAQKLS